MPRKSYTIEQIISKLREAEVLLAQRQTAGEVCRSFNIIDQTYYRWRKEYGGIRTDQVRLLEGVVSAAQQFAEGDPASWAFGGSCLAR